MKKIYIVEKAKNGFIVRFDHLKCSFETPKLCVAKTLDEVLKILKEDIKVVDIIETPISGGISESEDLINKV
jgi:hypothetical protein